jgi:ATP-dependent Clp protease ATP-binding subunit ClpB
VTSQTVNHAIELVRQGREADTTSAEEGYYALKRYARHLTVEVREGKLAS